jgi:hypothetical protein
MLMKARRRRIRLRNRVAAIVLFPFAILAALATAVVEAVQASFSFVFFNRLS